MKQVNWAKLSENVGPCLRPGGDILTRRALEVCDLPAGSRIVDVGSGAGATLEFLEKAGAWELFGVDPSEALLQEAAKRLHSARLVQGRADALPLAENSCDAVLCECVLSLFDDKAAALLEFERVLKSGGYLVLSDLFTSEVPGQPQVLTPAHVTRATLCGFLEKRGFTLLLWEDHKQLLKEFLVRMIFAGEKLPECWGCGGGGVAGRTGAAALSYFLMVARKA